MAQEPHELQREIHEIRSGLDDVADELNRRIADTRRKLSPRFLLHRHRVAASLVATGLVALGLLWRALRRRHRRHLHIR